jgi:hypothetical protein
MLRVRLFSSHRQLFRKMSEQTTMSLPRREFLAAAAAPARGRYTKAIDAHAHR